jgi:predicted amidophosphoribosyltransferase
MTVFDEFLDLLLPCRCVNCSSTGVALCENCALQMAAFPRAVDRFDLQGWVATDYGSLEKCLVKAFKEDGITALAPIMARFMEPAFAGLRDGVPTLIDDALLVPAPSSKENFRKRGFLPTLVLARKLNLATGGLLKVKAALRFVRGVLDQSGLPVELRQSNLSGSMQASRVVSGQRVILLDDVVTTGATLLEAARAIDEAGGEVIGFLTFSETILKTQAKS